jgi:N-methylhydantoinase B/oxoprolinase/acetone carboxylase alpha subunit
MPLVNGDCLNIPVEIIESRFPLRVERYGLFDDSGGPAVSAAASA